MYSTSCTCFNKVRDSSKHFPNSKFQELSGPCNSIEHCLIEGEGTRCRYNLIYNLTTEIQNVDLYLSPKSKTNLGHSSNFENWMLQF